MTIISALGLLITVVILAALLLNLIIMLRPENKRGKIVTAFNGAVAEFKLSISKQDTLGDRIIGLDEASRKLLFVATERGKPSGYIIDMNDVKSATVKKEYGFLFEGYSRKGIADTGISKIEIELVYDNGAHPRILPFYDKENDPVSEMSHRARQANVWQRRLSGLLTERRSTSEKRYRHAA